MERGSLLSFAVYASEVDETRPPPKIKQIKERRKKEMMNYPVFYDSHVPLIEQEMRKREIKTTKTPTWKSSYRQEEKRPS